MSAGEEFEELWEKAEAWKLYKDNQLPVGCKAIVKWFYNHQQQKIDKDHQFYKLVNDRAIVAEIKVRELDDINTKLSEALGSALEDFQKAQQKTDKLEEGINAALSYNLPYLAEKMLREVLEEGS